MSLFWYRRRIDALLIEDLSAEQAQTVRAHLRTCDACRRYYDSIAATRDLLEPAAAHGERLVARLSVPTERPSRPERREARVLMFAVATALVVAFVMLRPGQSSEATEGEPTFGGRQLIDRSFRLNNEPVPTLDVSPVGLRGGGDSGVSSPLQLRLYGRAADGTARLLAELPGAGELSLRKGAPFRFAASSSERVAVSVDVRSADGVYESWLQEQHVAATHEVALVGAEQQLHGSSPWTMVMRVRSADGGVTEVAVPITEAPP